VHDLWNVQTVWQGIGCDCKCHGSYCDVVRTLAVGALSSSCLAIFLFGVVELAERAALRRRLEQLRDGEKNHFFG